MKKLILTLIMTCATTFAFAKEAYELVSKSDGHSYIQINEDLDSFSFKSDFKSIGNSGKVGFFIYKDGLSGEDLDKYISDLAKSGGAEFSKHHNDGIVDLGKLNAGSKVGFYLDRNNGDVIKLFDFQEKHGVTYIAFDKNGGKGKDEWMSFENAQVAPTTAGAPLPNAALVLLLGLAGCFLIYGARKHNHQM